MPDLAGDELGNRVMVLLVINRGQVICKLYYPTGEGGQKEMSGGELCKNIGFNTKGPLLATLFKTTLHKVPTLCNRVVIYILTFDIFCPDKHNL